MAEAGLLGELIAYVGLDTGDAQLLRSMGPKLAPTFPSLVDEFYRAIDGSEAAAVIRGDVQRERLRRTMLDWLETLFSGVYDEAYFERRARIGRMHVRIELAQRYMFAAMNVLRRGLHHALDEHGGLEGEELRRGHDAIDRICDIELAVMLETYREAYEERRRAHERLATIGQLAASIGHELRNPLAVMETSIHLVAKRVDDPRAEKHIQRVREQLAISGSIITDLLETARDRAPERTYVRLETLVEEALKLVPPFEGVEIVRELPASLPMVSLDRTQFRQLIVNLVLNAAQSISSAKQSGSITISAEIEAGELVVRVRDEGPGLTLEAERRLFEPLFTTRARGVGLGLPLCRRIAEKHGGTIRGSNVGSPDAPAGACFEVRVPAS